MLSGEMNRTRQDESNNELQVIQTGKRQGVEDMKRQPVSIRAVCQWYMTKSQRIAYHRSLGQRVTYISDRN